MYHFFVSTQQIIDNQITITGSDVNHIRNVLRLKPGEIILISDDRQMDYRCKISRLETEFVIAAIQEKEENNHELPPAFICFRDFQSLIRWNGLFKKLWNLEFIRLSPYP